MKKLEELGLVIEDKGDYKILREVKVGILEQFIKLGTFMLPRYVFYATMFTTLLIFFISQFKEFNFYSSFALIFGVLGTIILWYETIRFWGQKP